MTYIDIPCADLQGRYGFAKGAGAGNWYSPNQGSDNHVHLAGLTRNPGYDPVKNRHAPAVLAVKMVELKMDPGHRWFGDIQDDGTFMFDTAKISRWPYMMRRRMEELRQLVPAPLTADQQRGP